MSLERRDVITVVVADDHRLVREGVRAFLATQGDIEVVAEAATGTDAATLCELHAPDVALLDLLMPDGDGVETTRRIRAVSPRTQVVILTSYHDDSHILPAIRAGALSYLLKDVPPIQLADAIRAAAKGDVTFHPRVAAQVMAALRDDKTSDAHRLAELTAREFEILRLVADGRTNAEIADRLFISEKTVKSHVSNVLGKLHLADRTKAAAYAWRSGLMRG